jgi:cysteine desulfurase / selenocysteine lyase
VHKLPGEHFRYELDRTARKYEFASPAFTGIYQMERAIDYLTAVGLDRIESHVVTLANYLNHELRGLGYDVLTPAGNASGIVAFAYRGEPDALQKKLDIAKIVVTNRGEERHVRVSVGVHNNRSEVELLLDVLRDFS